MTRKMLRTGVVVALAAAGTAAVGFLAAGDRLHLSPREANATTREANAAGTEAPTDPAPEPVAVTVAEVTPRPVQRRVAVVGTLFGREEAEIAPEVGGRVARIRYDVGDVARPGDVLLEIDDREYRLAVAEAERALELELAKLGLGEPPGPGFDVDEIPAVVRARLLESQALSALDRVRKLAARGAATDDQREQAETDFKVARANVRQALLEAGQALASVRHRQALLETAREKLADTKVLVPRPSPGSPAGGEEGATVPAVDAARSAVWVVAASPRIDARSDSEAAAEDEEPVEYLVAERMISEGEMIDTMPPTPLFRLVMDRPLKLQAAVPERHVGEIRAGQRVEIASEAYPGETFRGTVSRVNPTVDRLNRTFRIEAHVPNEDRRLRPGGFVKAAVLTREDPLVPTIPEEALVRFAGVVKVFVVEADKARAVPVAPGVRLGGASAGDPTWVEVVGDLPAGTAVVTGGHSQLADGTPVRVRGATSGGESERAP